MIELKVKDYCQNCGMFEPEATSVEYTYGSIPEKTIINTTVYCKYSDSCRCIYERIKEEYEDYDSSNFPNDYLRAGRKRS